MSNVSDKYRILGVYLILASVTFAVYWQVHTFDFAYYDDPDYVSTNPHIQSGLTLANIIWAFTTGYAANWHPLTWLSHMLDLALFGHNAGRHHVTNLMFHIANTLLLFTVLKRMTGAMLRSAFVAALFALHPLHVESVAWIAERKDVLSGFFWILTMLCYVGYAERLGTWRYLLTLLVFALGLMAKPMLVTLPFALLLLDYWPLERFPLRPADSRTRARPGTTVFHLFAEKMPFLVLSTVSSIITLVVQQKAVVTMDNLPLGARIGNCFISYWQYITKMIWPSNLAALYPYFPDRVAYWRVVITALILSCITICVFRLALKYKYLLVGWFWFLGTLVPVIGLVQVGEQALADRYTYIPLVGLFIIITWGVADLLTQWKYRNFVLGLAASLILVVLSVTTYLQVSHWKHPLTLFEHALAVTDRNYMVNHFIAQYLYSQGQIDKAMEYDRQALIIQPKLPQANNSLGFALVQKGRLAEAVVHFKNAIQLRPNHPEAYCNAGGALSDLGKYDEAARYLNAALKIDPSIAEAHYNLGIIYAKQGRLDKAVEHLERTVQLSPDLPKAYNNLGVVLSQQGKLDEAVANLQQAIRLDPNNAQARRNLELVLQQKNSPAGHDNQELK